MLAKGPVGVIAPSLIILIFLTFEKKLNHLKEFIQIKGIILFIATVVPWFIAACFIGGKDYPSGVKGYAYELIIRQNVIRFFQEFLQDPAHLYHVPHVIDQDPLFLFNLKKDFLRMKPVATD